MAKQLDLVDPSYLALCKRSPRGAYISEIFYNHQASSDVILKFHDRQIYAHKVVLQKASDVFGAAFSGRWTNAATNEYNIDAYNADVVVTMIKHIYGFELCGIESHTVDEKMQFLLDVYMIGEEYLITTLQMEVIEKIKVLLKELYNIKDDDEPLEQAIEAIITLHETHQLRDRRPRGDWESCTLLETTARFCTKWEPRCVQYICTPSEDDPEQFLKRYTKFTKEMREAFENPRSDSSHRDPGCMVCEYDVWGYDCYCKQLIGDWSQGFVDRIERFRPEVDEDPAQDQDEGDAEDEDEQTR